MTELVSTPRLIWPNAALRESYLTGERDNCLASGDSTEWLDEAAHDFDAFIAHRRGVHILWGVPSTFFWYVSGEHYLGTLVIRHRLTAELTKVGGHIGYHIVPAWRRQGHATRMLAAGLAECRFLGLDRVLLTCSTDNAPSRKVILSNGGIPDGSSHNEDRFWISLP